MQNKLLIVEDELDFQNLLKQRAQFLNFLCETDSTGQNFLEKARSFLPDVIILDLNLPKIDGMNLIREAKKDAIISQIPIIICSAYAETEKINKAMDIGADTYFIKSGDLTDLFAIIQSYINVDEKACSS